MRRPQAKEGLKPEPEEAGIDSPRGLRRGSPADSLTLALRLLAFCLLLATHCGDGYTATAIPITCAYT